MSEIVASNVNAGTNETDQMIEDLQNVGTVDTSAKLSALLDKNTGNPSPVKDEVSNGLSGDNSEIHHNGSTQNGEAGCDQTCDTKVDDASSPASASGLASSNVITQSPTKETPVEVSRTSTGASPQKSDEINPENQSINESKSETSVGDVASENQTAEQSNEDSKTEKSIDESNSTEQSQSVTSTASETEVPSSAESSECPVKDVSSAEDQDSMNKQMEELNVESEGSKGPSPGKKSCSPF